MTQRYALTVLVMCGALLANVVHAQVATTIEQAELAGLSAPKRSEVQQRANQPGQTVSEVLATILLNSIKSKHPASRSVALDFGRALPWSNSRAEE